MSQHIHRCGHCQRMKPDFSLAAQMAENEMAEGDGGGMNVQFVQVDVTKNPQLGEDYGVRGYPTVKLFKSGGAEVLDFQSNDRKADDLLNWVCYMTVYIYIYTTTVKCFVPDMPLVVNVHIPQDRC